MASLKKANPKVSVSMNTLCVACAITSIITINLMPLFNNTQREGSSSFEPPSCEKQDTALTLSSHSYQRPDVTEYTPSTFESYVYKNSDELGLTQTAFDPSGCYLWGYDDDISTEEEKKQLRRVPPDIRQQYFDHVEQMKHYQSYIANEFQLTLPPIPIVIAKESSETSTKTSFSDLRHALRFYNHSVVCDAVQVPWDGTSINSQATIPLLSHTVHSVGSRSTKQYMEPLLPQLRHAAICENTGLHLLDMNYMVHDFNFICNSMTPHTRTIFVDMGGSLLFHSGHNPAVIVAKLYQQFGIQFDHVYAFEMTPFTQEQTKSIFESLLPNMWQASYHWINVGVDSTVNAPLNPFTMIKEHFLPEDFIVVKLDIDTPSVELPLSQELLSDPILHTLIDQFYFEYHVKLKELSTSWVEHNEGSIYDALHLMTQLREKGIASHFWV